MKAMNFESTKWRREALDDVVVDEETLARRRRNRRIVIGLAVAILLAIAAVFMFGGSGEQAAAPQGDQGRQLPAVTVIVPGRQDVPMMLSATGSLAARRDMQVGVPGEGGQVVRVLAEPGQWVRAGQTLAVIDRRVQAQEAQQLAAQIEVNRADLRLAESELQRGQALVGRGFISQADIDRKRATRDAAAARVRVAEAQLAAARARIGQLDVRAPTDGLIPAILFDRRHHFFGQIIGEGTQLDIGRDDMIDGRQSPFGKHDGQVAIAQHGERLWARHLVNQVQANEQLRLPGGQRANGVKIPDFVEQIAPVGHFKIHL